MTEYYQKPSLLNRIKIWFRSLGHSKEFPPPDSEDHVDLDKIDLAESEFMIIGSSKVFLQ